MPYALAPHLHIALFEQRAILLDIRADRYRSLGSRAATVLRSIAAGRVANDVVALDALLAADIVRPGPAPLELLDLPIPTRAMSDRVNLSARTLSWRRAAASLLTVMWTQASRGFEPSLDLVRAHKARGSLRRDIDGAASLAYVYRKIRPRIPVRPICLRDSLALMILLIEAGLDATLVLGVRVDPFAAHSWVQAGSMLLSDDADIVAEFTPIFAL